jgi:hypothetical protein
MPGRPDATYADIMRRLVLAADSIFVGFRLLVRLLASGQATGGERVVLCRSERGGEVDRVRDATSAGRSDGFRRLLGSLSKNEKEALQ